MRHYGFEKSRFEARGSRWRRAALTLCVAFFSAVGIAATSRVVFDVVNWHDSAGAARAVSGDASATQQHRIDAIVVMLRDATESIQCLHRDSKDREPIAAHARSALASLGRAIERK